MTNALDGPNPSNLHVQVQYRLIEALQEREHQLAEAQRLAHMGSWAWDLTTGTVDWSDELYRILGLPTGEAIPTSRALFDLVPEADRERCRDIVKNTLRAGDRCDFTCAVVQACGAERWVRVTADVDRDIGGTPVRMHGITQDITAFHDAQQAFVEIEGLFRALVENTSDILTIVDRTGAIRYSSPSAARILEYEDGARVGVPFLDLIHPDDAPRVAAVYAALRATAGATITTEARVIDGGNRWRTLECTAVNLFDDPSINGLLVTSRDVSERKRMEAELEFETMHDPLTGLPNRLLLAELGAAALARAARKQTATALIIVDVLDFRAVNEALGFQVGDEVLTAAGARLDRAFRLSDGVGRSPASVGRFAGDEFLVLCEEVDLQGALPVLWHRIELVFAETFPAGEHELSLQVRAGIAVAAPGHLDFDVLLREAEAALRVAKSRPGTNCELYDQDLRLAESARTEARLGLERALDQGELRLYYQPKVALGTGLILGVEGLLRWEHPERGLVPPVDFIPLAEETGLIVPIGAWVIEEACRQAARWTSENPQRPPLLVCVNVSVRQFAPELLQTVGNALAAAGLPGSSFGIEVTESIVMGDVAAATALLVGLKEMGVLVAIDDFGTGYSSLAYLKQFQLDELKIDKSFVDGLGHDGDDTAIVSAVIALSHALGLGVIAEGVETADQVARLRALGCDVAQGYFFAKPGPAAAIDALLRDEAAASWRLGRTEALPLPTQDSSVGYRAERILIVDDQPEIRQLARMSMAAVGFEVYEASDGVECVEMAARLAPDCILLDVSMPRMGGFEACKVLRAHPATAGCTILMLTANTDASDKVEAFSGGADDYVIKPFSPRDLTARIQSAMARRRANASGSL